MNKNPNRISDEQGQVNYARLEATPFGLALVDNEPICDEGARQILKDIDRQVSEIRYREAAAKVPSDLNEPAAGSPTPTAKR